MKKILRPLLLAAALLSTGALAVDTTALERELNAIVGTPAQPLASLAVLAVRDGQVAYHGEFGVQSFASGRPTAPDTLYRVASISKLVTTLGVLQLVEQGKLDLDADLSRLLGFPLRNPHFPDTPISLRQLLTHTSSLRDGAGYFWPADTPLQSVLQPGGQLYGQGLAWSSTHPPGKYFAYTNLNFGVIAQAMERATGERFDRLMKRLILDPLSLAGGFHPADFSERELALLATLYRKRIGEEGHEIWNPQGPWVPQVDDVSAGRPAPRAGPDYVVGSNGTAFSPQGGLRISAEGLGRLMRMLMARGTLDGVTLLRPASVEQLFARHWTFDGRNGDSNQGQFLAWGLGAQHFTDASGADAGNAATAAENSLAREASRQQAGEAERSSGRGDRLVENGGFKAVGHLGDAWGLTAVFAFDPRSRNGLIFLSGGPGFDPQTTPGRYSSHYRYEEEILTTLYRRVLAPR